MNKIYNSQEDFASSIKEFLHKVFPTIRKTQLKIIPYILLGLILSESVVPSDISKKLKGDFSRVQIDSVSRRIRRFFSNKLFQPYAFYDAIIKHVIKSYKTKHSNKIVHIAFDHMFSHKNYTVFMITMRIGKQGIRLWFRCFKGDHAKESFQENMILEGIKYVNDLFGSDYHLIYLADRWFNSTNILNCINTLGHTYCIRTKDHKILIYDKKEGHEVWKNISDLSFQKYHALYYKNVKYTNKEYITNIAISRSVNVSEPLIIITNGEPNRAIRDYTHRYGGIEAVFKNQKTNGFYLEKCVNASEKYFESMYCLVCLATLFLTILGADYSKNTKCYKNVKITTHTKRKGKFVRIISLFNTGLHLFNIAFNSEKYVRISYHFILYDI